MNPLSSRDRALVGLGAALGSNCIPCVEQHVPLARSAGLSDDEIRAALDLADTIRKVPARRVLARATELAGIALPESVADAGCSMLDAKPVERTLDAMTSTMQRMMASCGTAAATAMPGCGSAAAPKSGSGCC